MDLQELSQWMKERNLKGHWEHSEWSQSVKPYLWKGDEIMQALNWSRSEERRVGKECRL